MQIKSARIVRYGKALGKICMEIRIKICAPILCVAFGSDPNPQWPSVEDRLLRNYTTISVSREQNYNFTIVLLSPRIAILLRNMSGRIHKVTRTVWKNRIWEKFIARYLFILRLNWNFCLPLINCCIWYIRGLKRFFDSGMFHFLFLSYSLACRRLDFQNLC